MDEDVNPTGGVGPPGAMVPRGSIRAPLLVVGAVAAGLVLYLVVHHSDSAGVPIASTSTPTVTTPSTGSSTPTASGASQTPLVVLNGAGSSATAVAKIATLRSAGYPIVATATSTATTGTAVQCKTGLSKQARALATTLGGATMKPFPNPVPAIFAHIDCVVTIGT